MTMDPEQQTSEVLKSSIEGLATSVMGDLVEAHAIDPTSVPDLRQSLFTGYTRQRMEGTLAGMGAVVEGGLGAASVTTFPHEDGADHIEQMVWFDTTHPYISALEGFTDYEFEKSQQGFLIVTEEVSHFLYKDQYYKRYGEEPPEWLVEMVGAVDKYDRLQSMYMQRHGRKMNPQEERLARRDIFTALDAPPGTAPEHYREAHSFAGELIRRRAKLIELGWEEEAAGLLPTIYAAKGTEAIWIAHKLTDNIR